MAIRIRRVKGRLVALCAAETDPKLDDMYLDDEIHYALAQKFWREDTDWYEDDEELKQILNSQKMRDAEEELAKWFIEDWENKRKLIVLLRKVIIQKRRKNERT